MNPPLQPIPDGRGLIRNPQSAIRDPKSAIQWVGEISHPVFLQGCGGAFAALLLFLFSIFVARNFLSEIDSWAVIAVFFHVADFPAGWLSSRLP